MRHQAKDRGCGTGEATWLEIKPLRRQAKSQASATSQLPRQPSSTTSQASSKPKPSQATRAEAKHLPPDFPSICTGNRHIRGQWHEPPPLPQCDDASTATHATPDSVEPTMVQSQSSHASATTPAPSTRFPHFQGCPHRPQQRTRCTQVPSPSTPRARTSVGRVPVPTPSVGVGLIGLLSVFPTSNSEDAACKSVYVLQFRVRAV
jgi:hypothetical protein